MRIGYAAICEEHPGSAIVDNARYAAQAGFAYVSVSDHFHPWLDEEGHSPFAWSVLGALASPVDVELMTAVTCPTTRYHPLLIAQAAATVAEMAPGGLTLGLGTGEALNEHVVGGPWPDPRVRLDQLEEAVGILRRAWEGEQFTHLGEWFTVDRARVYTLPEEAPPIVIAAGGDESGRRAAELGAGLVTTSPDSPAIEAYRGAGGDGPLYGQATVCWAPDEDEAASIFHERWRHAVLDWTAKTDIPTPEGFDQATTLATPDTFRDGVPLGPNPTSVGEDLDGFRQAGFDAVAVHCVGPYQESFVGWAADELL